MTDTNFETHTDEVTGDDFANAIMAALQDRWPSVTEGDLLVSGFPGNFMLLLLGSEYSFWKIARDEEPDEVLNLAFSDKTKEVTVFASGEDANAFYNNVTADLNTEA